MYNICISSFKKTIYIIHLFFYSETFEIIHSRGVITLLAIYKIPKLKYFCALRNTPVDLAKVHYLESFAIYGFKYHI